MISRTVAIFAFGTLTACAASVPDSNPNAGGGVGFSNHNQYISEREARDAALEARRAVVPEERAIAQETLGVLNATSTGTTVASTQPTGADVGAPLAATALVASNPEISDEQNFDAVSSRETIESDRERLARQSDAFQVAAPEAVPDRPGSSGPNIVAYALSTTNRVGEPVHNRRGRFNEDKYRRACAIYGSTDQAQVAFLEAGGPKRDRRGLDPDGDGFACRWDPTPFRNARGG
ncbi:MAG: hypothetical protein HKN18_17180 [Silicimonas sp.]|nr:hypothetical protein [Silicimonas sp.]